MPQIDTLHNGYREPADQTLEKHCRFLLEKYSLTRLMCALTEVCYSRAELSADKEGWREVARLLAEIEHTNPDPRPR